DVAQNLARLRVAINFVVDLSGRSCSYNEINVIEISGFILSPLPNQFSVRRPLLYSARSCGSHHAHRRSAIEQAANFLFPNTALSQDQAVASLKFEEHREQRCGVCTH